jgi:hypothetical protein
VCLIPWTLQSGSEHLLLGFENKFYIRRRPSPLTVKCSGSTLKELYKNLSVRVVKHWKSTASRYFKF